MVDPIMADIAVVFHWPPESMAAMSIPELMGWHDQARQRASPADE